MVDRYYIVCFPRPFRFFAACVLLLALIILPPLSFRRKNNETAPARAVALLPCPRRIKKRLSAG